MVSPKSILRLLLTFIVLGAIIRIMDSQQPINSQTPVKTTTRGSSDSSFSSSGGSTDEQKNYRSDTTPLYAEKASEQAKYKTQPFGDQTSLDIVMGRQKEISYGLLAQQNNISTDKTAEPAPLANQQAQTQLDKIMAPSGTRTASYINGKWIDDISGKVYSNEPTMSYKDPMTDVTFKRDANGNLMAMMPSYWNELDTDQKNMIQATAMLRGKEVAGVYPWIEFKSGIKDVPLRAVHKNGTPDSYKQWVDKPNWYVDPIKKEAASLNLDNIGYQNLSVYRNGELATQYREAYNELSKKFSPQFVEEEAHRLVDNFDDLPEREPDWSGFIGPITAVVSVAGTVFGGPVLGSVLSSAGSALAGALSGAKTKKQIRGLISSSYRSKLYELEHFLEHNEISGQSLAEVKKLFDFDSAGNVIGYHGPKDTSIYL